MQFKIIVEHQADHETKEALSQILTILKRFRLEERIMNAELQAKFDEAVAEVSAIGDVVQSNDALLDNLTAMLEDALANATNLEEVKAAVGNITTMIAEKKTILSNAVVEHTPAAPPVEPPPV